MGGVRLRWQWAIVLILLGAWAPPGAVSVHDFSQHVAPPEDCEPATLSLEPGYLRPLVRQRWERALVAAPNVCRLADNGPAWECNYSEAVPAAEYRLCWWPIPAEPAAGSPPRLDVLINPSLLRRLAETALGSGAVAELLGEGTHHVEVRVEDAAASLRVEGLEVRETVMKSPPPACVPFAATSDAAPVDARATCAMDYPPTSGMCRHVEVGAFGRYVCWWGAQAPQPDFVIEMSGDTLRAILNAEDGAAATQWALQNEYLTLWSSSPFKRAAIRAALDYAVGDVPQPLRPPEVGNTQITLQGRLFHVSYFPRDGVLTPCARDGQGTWYWLNEFGVPNGFVGSATIRAMQLYLQEHDGLPSDQEVLDDLLLNYQPGRTLQTPNGPAPLTYLFRPGSPFALIPVLETDEGLQRVRGDGSLAGAVEPADATAAAARIAAAKTVTRDVDFNRQPGTLAQDLRFLRYAIDHNPAAMQIETTLASIGNGTPLPAEDLLGLVPQQARLGPIDDAAALAGAIAQGDALLLGMASHTIIWQDLVSSGAIQPASPEVGP